MSKHRKFTRIDFITNRIFINFIMAVFAYVLLWVLLAIFNMSHLPVFICSAAFFITAVVLLILKTIKKYKVSGYIAMFFIFSAALMFTQSAFIVSNIIDINKFSDILRNSDFLRYCFNTLYEVKFIAIAGGGYMIGMMFYNCLLISKLTSRIFKRKRRRRKRK